MTGRKTFENETSIRSEESQTSPVHRSRRLAFKKSLRNQSYESQRLLLKPDTTPLSPANQEAVAKEGFRGATRQIPYKTEMESAFGVNLDHVRARTGEAATQASEMLGAEAYTYGTDVAFRDENPSLGTVAHEVHHVVQQSDGSTVSEPDQEAEANRAEKLVRSSPDGRSSTEPLRPSSLQQSSGPVLRFKLREEVSKAELLSSKTGPKKEVPQAKIPEAISYNNKRWQGRLRADLLGYLRGANVPEGAQFTQEDVKKAAALQDAAGLDVDGLIGDKTIAVFLHAGLKFSEEAAQATQGTVKLIFYPGELENLQQWQHEHQLHPDEWRKVRMPEGNGRLYVEVNGRVVAKYKARGGPPFKFQDGKHTSGPTPAGTYQLGAQHRHTTASWYYSQIPWGTELRYSADGQVEFKSPGSTKWQYATGPKSVLRQPMEVSDFLEGGQLPKTYKRNDFGEWAWNLTKGGGTPYYVHTTPEDEETSEVGQDVVLSTSHGCIHLDPAERNEMMKRGYLRAGVTLVVRQYTVHLLSGRVRDLLNPGSGME